MRVFDWEARLNQVIEGARNKPFEWGGMDCLRFVEHCHFAMTQKFIAEEWFCDYKNPFEAKRAYAQKLKETGFASIIEGIDAKLDRVSAATAQRGSIVARPVSDYNVLGYSLGVVVSNRIAFPSGAGLEFLPPEENDIFWSVG